MLLEFNDTYSIGKMTRYISIIIFFITNHIKNRDIIVEHDPTDRMIADFFTKPLQGALFRKCRKEILNEDELFTGPIRFT